MNNLNKKDISSFIENEINTKIRRPIKEITVDKQKKVTRVYLGFESYTQKPAFIEYSIHAIPPDAIHNEAYQSRGTVQLDHNLDVMIRNYLNNK